MSKLYFIVEKRKEFKVKKKMICMRLMVSGSHINNSIIFFDFIKFGRSSKQ